MHDELLNDFLEESIDLIEKVKSALAAWNSTSDKSETIDNIYRWVHTIKGGCSIFEYKETAHIAHELESFLGTLRSKVNDVSMQELKKVEEGILRIESTFHANGHTAESTIAELFLEDSVTEASSSSFDSSYFQEWMKDSDAIVKDLYKDGFRFFEIVLPKAISEKIIGKLQEYEVFTLDTYEKDESLYCLCSTNLKASPEFEKRPTSLSVIIMVIGARWLRLNIRQMLCSQKLYNQIQLRAKLQLARKFSVYHLQL